MARKKQKHTADKVRELLKDNITYAADGKEYKLLDLVDAEDFEQDQNGNLYIKHMTLLKTAKRYLGIKGKQVEVLQCPEKSNNWNAVIKVTYKFTSFVWSAVADCNRLSAPRDFEQYTTALAETRASARCLRDALGIEFCSVEEVTTMDQMDNVVLNDKSPITSTQKKAINKLLEQKNRTIEDVGEIIGRKIEQIEEMTKVESTIVIDELNGSKRKE